MQRAFICTSLLCPGSGKCSANNYCYYCLCNAGAGDKCGKVIFEIDFYSFNLLSYRNPLIIQIAKAINHGCDSDLSTRQIELKQDYQVGTCGAEKLI